MLTLHVGVYEYNVIVVDGIEELQEVAMSIGAPLKEPPESGGCCYHVAEAGLVVIYLADSFPGVIAHEALHAANYILSDVGAQGSYEDDECQAYLLGYLVQHIHSGLKVKKRKKFEW